MKADELNALERQAAARMVELRAQKGKEYTRGDADVLANFKRVGRELVGITITADNAAAIVWFVYFHKHFDALASFIRNGAESSNEGIEGRIDDMQVYLTLQRGIAQELKAVTQRRQVEAGRGGGEIAPADYLKAYIEKTLESLEEIQGAIESRAREHDCAGFHCSVCVPSHWAGVLADLRESLSASMRARDVRAEKAA